MDRCALCFNVMEEDNCITFQCDHTFCKYCANKIIFTTTHLQCPIDKMTITTFVDRNQSKTMDQYKSDWWNDEGKSIQIDFEYNCSEIIISMIDVVNTIIDILIVNDKGDLGNCSLQQDSHTRAQCCRIKTLIDKMRDIHDLSSYFMSSELEFVKNVILKYPSKQMRPIEFDVINERFELDISTLTNELNLLYTHCQKGNEDGNECFLEHFKDKLKYLTGLAISYSSNNGHIYRMARPHVNEIDINQCLICSTLITEQKCATFVQCHHKLCSDCIDIFMVMHGNCPFDNKGIDNLQISDNLQSVSTYLTGNYREIAAKLFNKYMNICIEVINQLLSTHCHISNWIGCVDDKELEMKTTKMKFIKINDVTIHSIANEFCDSLRRLKYITMDIQAHDYLNRMIDIFYQIETSVINNCKSIFSAYYKLAKKYSNSHDENRLHLQDFMSVYRTSSSAILQFNTDVGEKVFCTEVYGLINELQNVLTM